MRKIVIVVSCISGAALLVSSCARRNIDFNMSRGAAIGAGAGALLGGVVGYQFGGGIGQIIYTAAGVVGGASGGYSLGQRLEGVDRALYDNTARKALSSADDGQTSRWANPDSGSIGIFRTLSSSRPSNSYTCRDYRAVVALDQELLRENGTACQISDGQWVTFKDKSGKDGAG